MRTEKKLSREILAAFEHEPRINLHRHPIRVAFEKDAVALEGEVENVAAKKTALAIAARTPGVVGIVDRLRVARPTRMTDGEIAAHLRAALLEENAFLEFSLSVASGGHLDRIRTGPLESPPSIDAEIDDGVVTLNGKVPSLSHKRLAGVLAWWIPGTRDVVNGMEVAPDEVETDDEITDAVRLALEKDRLVDEAQIRVRTRDRSVTLEGAVASDASREMAELDAWYVLGVDRVENRLQVSSSMALE